MASTNQEVIEVGDQLNSNKVLHSLGKTVGMLSFSLFTVVISSFWFIWALLFIVILMFTKSGAIDHDQTWVFYVGAGIYLSAALLFNDPIFSERLLLQAPDYLSFPGSPFVYLLGFAFLAYAILKSGAKIKDWSTTLQLTYFIGIHVTFITIFFRSLYPLMGESLKKEPWPRLFF